LAFTHSRSVCNPSLFKRTYDLNKNKMKIILALNPPPF
jgi:hypothetical protein